MVIVIVVVFVVLVAVVDKFARDDVGLSVDGLTGDVDLVVEITSVVGSAVSSV